MGLICPQGDAGEARICKSIDHGPQVMMCVVLGGSLPRRAMNLKYVDDHELSGALGDSARQYSE